MQEAAHPRARVGGFSALTVCLAGSAAVARACCVPGIDGFRQPAANILWWLTDHRVRFRQAPIVGILFRRMRRYAEVVRNAVERKEMRGHFLVFTARMIIEAPMSRAPIPSMSFTNGSTGRKNTRTAIALSTIPVLSIMCQSVLEGVNPSYLV